MKNPCSKSEFVFALVVTAMLCTNAFSQTKTEEVKFIQDSHMWRKDHGIVKYAVTCDDRTTTTFIYKNAATDRSVSNRLGRYFFTMEYQQNIPNAEYFVDIYADNSFQGQSQITLNDLNESIGIRFCRNKKSTKFKTNPEEVIGYSELHDIPRGQSGVKHFKSAEWVGGNNEKGSYNVECDNGISSSFSLEYVNIPIWRKSWPKALLPLRSEQLEQVNEELGRPACERRIKHNTINVPQYKSGTEYSEYYVYCADGRDAQFPRNHQFGYQVTYLYPNKSMTLYLRDTKLDDLDRNIGKPFCERMLILAK